MSEMMNKKWNQRYAQAAFHPQAAMVLEKYTYLLPQKGRALDLACGTGGNALLLAGRGLETCAWDISDVAINQLVHAENRPEHLQAEVRDVERHPPEPNRFDVIVVSYFLSRPLMTALVSALRPEGLLFYQTFTEQRIPGAAGPSNPDFLLKPNELLHAFLHLQTLVYQEEGLTGDLDQGVRNIALYVGKK